VDIKDPIHGYIKLTGSEKKLLDSPQVQRLRRIRQLGLSSQVYPGATHTRFQHSLGVMYLASQFADSLNLGKSKKKEIRTAGLLHDTGHGPFSHASENVAEKRDIDHEDISCNVVDQLSEKITSDTERIKKIIKGELEIGQTVAGDIDADRIDYLMRDAHNSGLNHGQIEADTIINFSEIDSRRLVHRFKSTQALESLFTARLHNTKSLYKHHTSQIAEKMLEKAFESMLNQGLEIMDLMRMNDYKAHNKLLSSEGSAKELYSRIMDRNLHKRGVTLDQEDLSRQELEILEKENEKQIEKEIIDKTQVDEAEVIVKKPDTPSKADIDVKIKKDSSVRDFSEVSPMPEALHEASWRNVNIAVYCSKDKISDIKEDSKQIIMDKLQ
jgi:HD superfamily phosphohydrolases